jgi:hypothetical protein
MQAFGRGIERIADEFNIGKHSLAQLVNDGKATKQQIKQFAIEHYEMTVRDSGPYIANGYVNMCKLSAEGAELMADNFAEEALGLHTHTGGHCALLFEFWEMVFKSRRGREESSFVGCREDRWRWVDETWKLEERLIVLDHDVLENVTVFF